MARLKFNFCLVFNWLELAESGATRSSVFNLSYKIERKSCTSSKIPAYFPQTREILQQRKHVIRSKMA